MNEERAFKDGIVEGRGQREGEIESLKAALQEGIE